MEVSCEYWLIHVKKFVAMLKHNTDSAENIYQIKIVSQNTW